MAMPITADGAENEVVPLAAHSNSDAGNTANAAFVLVMVPAMLLTMTE